jgi:hypothetical protein
MEGMFMNNEKQNKVSMPKRMIDAVITLDKTIDERDSKVALIEQDYPSEKLKTEDYESRKQRLAKVNQEFEKKWHSSLKNLDELCKRVRQRQPHLNKLPKDNINTSSIFPDALAFGRLHLTYQNWRGNVPRLTPFPIIHSLWLSEKNADQNLIHQFLLRLMHSMPVGTVEITAADPLKLGKSLDPFLPLLKLKRLFPEQRLLTHADEMENALRHLTDYIEDLLQNKFNGDIKNWSAYNAVNRSNPLPYKILLVF